MSRKSIHSAKAGLLLLALVIPMSLSAQVEVDRYEMGRALPPSEPGQVLVEMTLGGAISRALESNLNIQSVRLNPLIQEFSFETARAAFLPSISGTFSHNNSTNQSTSQLDGGTTTTSKRQSFNGSLSETLPWYGGRLSASFNNSRNETNNAFSTRNPSYSSSLNFSYSQPLLAGLKMDNQRNALQTNVIQDQITDLQTQTQIENITNAVRLGYWNLRASIEAIGITQRSLAQAQELLAQNRIRVELGSMSELQVVQAEAQVVGAEQSLLNAEIGWRNQELNFKRLLVFGAEDELLNQTINPIELPVIVEQAVDIDEAIAIALEERMDIRQQRQQRDISELNLVVTESNRLPSLNLSAGYTVSGVGGDLYQRDGLGGEPILVAPGGWFDGMESIWGRDTPTWNLSLNFSYPLGMRSAKANLERARLQLKQTDLALKDQELTIVTQVTDAGLTVRDTYLQFQAAQRSREVSERSAEIEQTRFNVGASTNYEVVQAQDDLTSALLSELRSIINHVNAIAQFERVQRVGG
jgi:outer membrane protein TolC